MINDEQLNEYRLSGILVRVIRDRDEKNDVKGIVVAWNDESVMIRRRNRKIVKLSRDYIYQPYEDQRAGDGNEK
ncbi:hypothetical protein [Chengkuizengella axinellae]|uniref:DUF2187 domain-containing protein n=1 Tax=Chengkuizengella axinellae TaxID=3064388 RepID=A0ABT9IYY8_9BACL|nr:hypothetical protein [Chengkuizengella sp. 2205SS18-9]MDP5274581.1 hypothetical protein [Chengkuizengella sp. 2205SS18-9]